MTTTVQMTMTPADEKEIIALRKAVLGVCDNHELGNIVIALVLALESVLTESHCDPSVSHWAVDALRYAIEHGGTGKG
jgi:hypothetical protein